MLESVLKVGGILRRSAGKNRHICVSAQGMPVYGVAVRQRVYR